VAFLKSHCDSQGSRDSVARDPEGPYGDRASHAGPPPKIVRGSRGPCAFLHVGKGHSVGGGRGGGPRRSARHNRGPRLTDHVCNPYLQGRKTALKSNRSSTTRRMVIERFYNGTMRGILLKPRCIVFETYQSWVERQQKS
jgi:hypothetical protein